MSTLVCIIIIQSIYPPLYTTVYTINDAIRMHNVYHEAGLRFFVLYLLHKLWFRDQIAKVTELTVQSIFTMQGELIGSHKLGKFLD